MAKKVLFFFPNTSNRGRITTAIPIFAASARDRGWEKAYFDTSFYEKTDDSVLDREKTGGFMPGTKETIPDMLPRNNLIPDLEKLLQEFQPDLFVISAMTCDYQYLMTFFSKVKIPDKTLVLIGGFHVTFKPEKVLDTGLFDLACLGPGEAVFDEILDRIAEGGRIDDIKGTYFYDKNRKEIVRNPKRELLSAEKLWEKEEDYSFFNDRYFLYPFDGKTVRMFWLDMARGCPYACSYCGNAALKEFCKGLGKFIVTRSLDSTFRLLRRLVKDYKVDVFNITHECFLAQPTAWLEEFSERWARDVKKTFLIVTRAETVTEEKLNILKKSGAPVIQIGLGVESGSEWILREVCNRKVSNERTINAYKLMDEHGFRTSAYWMLGFPFETRENVFESIELCRKLNADVDSVSIFQPMPGQPITKMCIEKGLITGKETIPTFTSGSILKMPQFSAEEIYNLRRVFILYAKLPREYWPDLEKCEKDYESHKELYDQLVDLRWKKFAKKKTYKSFEKVS